MSGKNDGIGSALISGGLLVVVGILLLLNQMGVIHHWFNFWALVFFFVGLLNIVQGGRNPWGFVLMSAGVALELNQLGYLRIRLETYWPVFVTSLTCSRFGAGENTEFAQRIFGAAIWSRSWADLTSICGMRTSRAVRPSST